jgi:hypothetical protein
MRNGHTDPKRTWAITSSKGFGNPARVEIGIFHRLGAAQQSLGPDLPNLRFQIIVRGLMRKCIGILAVALALSTTSKVGAVSAAESLKPSPEYPAPECAKPDDKLIKLLKRKPEYSNIGGRADSGAVGSYNALVKAYNLGVRSYDSCISSYISAANGEIARLHDEAVAHIKQISDDANGRIKLIEKQITDVVDEANGTGGVPTAREADISQYPPSDCKKPAEIERERRTIARTTKYDQEERVYRSCVASYIADASGEIKQIQNNVSGGTRQIAEDANSRIGLVKGRIRDAIADADQTASADNPAAPSGGEITLAAIPPTDPGTESIVVTGERIKRSVDTPTGEGDPDAISCRLPQQLPDSRIPGPEICKRNSEWASLHKAGNDISSDGRSVVPSEQSRTTHAGMICTKVTTGSPYAGYITNELCN